MAVDDRSAAGLTPDQALHEGRWVKLICGASNQDLPSITDLTAVYAAAGVHCVDVAADPAVIRAARLGLDWAERRFQHRPWLMVSLSDGVDPHFRKAWFDPERCPADCPRPCARVCPADAIPEHSGVDEQRCYGCGRCLPACPLGLIAEREHRLPIAAVAALLQQERPDAVEIHTSPGRIDAFSEVVDALAASRWPLQRLAVSCGMEGHGIDRDGLAVDLWRRFVQLRRHRFLPLWQLDGRPMRGDIGAGTSRVAVQLWRALQPIAPPGPLQLAGGTNAATLGHLRPEERPAGVAFGGMARRLLLPLLQQAHQRGTTLRDWPEGWTEAVVLARGLITPWSSRPLLDHSC